MFITDTWLNPDGGGADVFELKPPGFIVQSYPVLTVGMHVTTRVSVCGNGAGRTLQPQRVKSSLFALRSATSAYSITCALTILSSGNLEQLANSTVSLQVFKSLLNTGCQETN